MINDESDFQFFKTQQKPFSIAIQIKSGKIHQYKLEWKSKTPK